MDRILQATKCQFILLAAVICQLILASPQLVVGQTKRQSTFLNSDKIQVERDKLNLETRIYIPAKNGKIHWIDITDSILQYADPDAAAFDLSKWKSRSGTIDLNSRASRMGLVAADIAIGDPLDFEILENPQRLLIRVRRESSSNLKLAKLKLRQIILKRNNGLKAAYGLSVPELKTKPTQVRPKDVCLFIHGLHSHCDGMLPLAEKVRALGYRVAFFEYPNDDRIAESAELLSKELCKVRHEDPAVRIHIVAHSMGGLVARKTVEEKSLDPGNVASLIMIATPNQGSKLAKIAHGLDFWEHFLENRDPTPALTKIQSSIADGLNDAAKDLRPDSKFLQQLNQLERNPKVRYSILIGTDSVLKSRQLALVLDKAKQYVGLTVAKQALSYARQKIQNLDEVVTGRGDGMVAVNSAIIPGVSDVEKFKLTHRQMWLSPDAKESQRLFEAVIKRLQ